MCDVVFLVRLQVKFDIDHSWECIGMKKTERLNWINSVWVTMNPEAEDLRPYSQLYVILGKSYYFDLQEAIFLR